MSNCEQGQILTLLKLNIFESLVQNA